MEAEPSALSEELNRALDAFAEVFAARSIPYALIGGLATLLRGRPRFTQDIDFILEVPQVDLPGLLDDLVARGFGLDVVKTIKEYTREHFTSFRFGSVRIDWLKPVLPIYAMAMTTATDVEWSSGHRLKVASPEGIVLTKMLSFRPQDQVDIETLIIANRDSFDAEFVRREWAPFAASEAERTAWLEDLLANQKEPTRHPK